MNELELINYEYELPKELIAQKPLENRDSSRLLVLDRSSGAIEHRRFSEIIDYLRPGDCLAVNRTKVVPARLYGKKATGGKVEVLFLDPASIKRGQTAIALVKPFMDTGKQVIFPDALTATVEQKTEKGETILALDGADPQEVLNAHGIMPLPPYIKRKDAGEDLAVFDRQHYQTVYAKEAGSIAAPTAGLHFTDTLLKAIATKGVAIAEITLHVGWGTFKPLVSNDISKHVMLPEKYEISARAAKTLNQCRQAGGRIIASGTTTVRTLESAARLPDFEKHGFVPVKTETGIFIYPGCEFKAVSRMITNFHLPHSTPLAMVCAFAGRDKIFAAYTEAIKERYRFFSYGDAMMML